MTALELRDYILKHMSAEEALLKLLQTSVEQYDRLKLSQPIMKEEDGTVNPLFILTAAVIDMGWDIMVEGKEGEKIKGLIIGEPTFVEEKAKALKKYREG